jgi:hypothetical protein
MGCRNCRWGFQPIMVFGGKTNPVNAVRGIYSDSRKPHLDCSWTIYIT